MDGYNTKTLEKINISELYYLQLQMRGDFQAGEQRGLCQKKG